MESHIEACWDPTIVDKLNECLKKLFVKNTELVTNTLTETSSYIFGRFILDCTRNIDPTRLDIAVYKTEYIKLMKTLSTFAVFSDITISDNSKGDYTIEYNHNGVEIFLHISSDKRGFILNLDYGIEMIWSENSTILGYRIDLTLDNLCGECFNYEKILIGDEKELSKFHRYIHQGYTLIMNRKVFNFKSFTDIHNKRVESLRSKVIAIKEKGIAQAHSILLENSEALYTGTS